MNSANFCDLIPKTQSFYQKIPSFRPKHHKITIPNLIYLPILDISLLRYFYDCYCRLEVTVTTLKLRHFVARQDDATYYGILSPHKTPPLWGIEGLPHGNAPRSPLPPSYTLWFPWEPTTMTTRREFDLMIRNLASQLRTTDHRTINSLHVI